MDREASQATVPGVTERHDLATNTNTYPLDGDHVLCSFLCGKKPIKLESSQGDFSVSMLLRTCLLWGTAATLRCFIQTLAADALGGQYFKCLMSYQNRECACMLSFVLLFVTPRTVACQAPQEYWGGLPFPSLGNLPDPGIEPESPASSPVAGGLFTASFLESPQAEREFMMPLYFRSFLGRLLKFLQWREGPIWFHVFIPKVQETVSRRSEMTSAGAHSRERQSWVHLTFGTSIVMPSHLCLLASSCHKQRPHDGLSHFGPHPSQRHIRNKFLVLFSFVHTCIYLFGEIIQAGFCLL